MKKVLAAVVTMAMTMSLLTACGSTAASTDEAAETTEATEATEASADETAEAETPVEEAADEAEVAEAAESEALADGVLTVGTNAEFPPFEYEADGFDMALCKAIGEKLGVEVKIENMEFASLVSSIGSKIDIAAAGMTVTDERKESVDFSNPYYEAVQYVIVSADSDIATADDLKDKTIGVQLGTTGDFIAEEYTSNVAQYNKAVDAVNDLVNGKVDVVIIDKNPALVFETKFEGKVKAIEGAQFGFETEEYAIALPKGDTALADAVNGAVDELKADGTFDELVKTYIEAE